MKGSKGTSYIAVFGVFILSVFAYVVAYNVIPKNRESNSYYAKTNDEMNAQIADIVVFDDVMTIKTIGNPTEFCVKTTKTTPKINSLCWKPIENNYVSTKIYSEKEYYVWIKDENNNISAPSNIKS